MGSYATLTLLFMLAVLRIVMLPTMPMILASLVSTILHDLPTTAMPRHCNGIPILDLGKPDLEVAVAILITTICLAHESFYLLLVVSIWNGKQKAGNQPKHSLYLCAHLIGRQT